MKVMKSGKAPPYRGRRPLRAVLLAGLLVVLLPLALLALAVLGLKGAILFDSLAFEARLRRLENNPPVSQNLPDAAIPDELPLNRLRLLATHNSYRAGSDPLGIRLIGLVKPAEVPLLAYSHPPLYRQLEAGIRSFELDLRPRGRRFVLAHAPLVDERSVAPDLAAALAECRLWSECNPAHVPIIIILELKSDWGFLDPFASDWDAAALDRLDTALHLGLGDKLFTPDQLRQNAGHTTGVGGNLQTLLAVSGWPTVGQLRGRFIIVLHQNQALRQLYTANQPALQGRAMFTCAPPGAADGGFAIQNDPAADAALIQQLTAANIIVRTRADAPPDTKAERLQAALHSGAQIVSTDYPPDWPHANGYAASLGNGRTMDMLD